MNSASEPALNAIPPPPGTPPASSSLTPSAAGTSPSASAALPALPAAGSLTSSAAAALKAFPTPPVEVHPLTRTSAVNGLSAPLYLTAIAGNRNVILSWYPSEGSLPVSGYLIFRGLSASGVSPAPINLTPVVESEYADNADNSVEGPADRRTYYYRVRAYAPDGRLSPYSDVVLARPSGPLLPPGAFKAAPLDGKALLTWTAPLSTGDADLARLILMKGDGTGPPARYKILAPDSLSFTDKGLADGKAVTYSLLSEDVRGRQSEQTKVLKVVPYRPLDAPKGLSGIGLGDDIVRLKWAGSPATGTYPLRGYNVYRATVGFDADYSKAPINKALVTDTSYEDESDDSTWAPVFGTQYTYTVVAVDGQGQFSRPSKPRICGPVASITKLETGTINVMAGNTLQIQGRKTINLSNTWILWRQNAGNTYGASSTSSFNLDQQLQVQLTGQVGRKIKVDVDYDDKAAANQQQKISVVYSGDSQEVFKEFAFGDIQMDLTSSRTEFAGYNKSLFGAKLKLDSPDEKLRVTAIGAQTQGFTETKTFIGGYEEVMNGTVPGHNYADTSFIPYKYYFLNREADLVEGTNNIIPGSVTIYVDEPGVSNLNPNRVTVTNPGTQTTYNFVPLVAGVDYLVDNKSGLVTFNAAIQPNYNIAVAFKTAQNMPSCNCSSIGYSGANFNFAGGSMLSNSTSGLTDNNHILIQNGAVNGSVGYDGHMSTQFYSMGDREIMDPKLDPNFKLIIYGPNQSVVYQLDPRSDYTNVVNFDTTLGIMRFRVPYPFQQGNTAGNMEMDIGTFKDVGTAYNGGQLDCYDLVQRTNNYTIHVEYQHKLSSYNLRPNVIHGSDLIIVDGRHVVRDVDYFLDYDTGILVFNNPDLVKDTSTVQATYEYLPFGGQFTSTVWGVRAEYDLNDNLSVGSTYLSDSANAPQTTPQITAGVYSLQLLDGDVQATAPQKAVDSMTSIITPRSGFLTIKASAEAAHSWFNPNTYSRNNENGVAMVDDFESVNSVVATSTLRQNWFPSSIPLRFNGDTGPASSDRRFTHLYTELDQAHNAQVLTLAGEDPSINMLRLDWSNYTSSSNWDSYLYSFGPTPNQSVSQSSLLQIWLRTTNRVTLHVDAGQINEDAVDNGTLATESTTGILATGEDIGIDNPTTVGSPYPCPQNDPGIYPDHSEWGWNNGILDTEDFEQTGVLDEANNYYTYNSGNGSSGAGVVVDPANQSPGVNNGFQELNLDLTQFTVVNPGGAAMTLAAGDPAYYTNISRLRIWIDGATASQGSLVIESIQFVGDKWQVRADPNLVNMAGTSVTANTNEFQVQAVNSSTALSQTANVAYVPDLDFYTVDSTHSASIEQALELQYALTAAQMSDGRPYYQARRVLSNGTPIDFGQYQKMRVDVFKPSYIVNGQAVSNLQGETFLVRLAADDQDYFEYAIPLDNVSPGGWQTITLALDGSDGARQQVGQPYLRQINYASFSIRTFNPSLNYAINTPLNQESIWVNNLRVTDPIVREGTAQRFAVNYNLMGGKVIVNQTYHEVDSDFVEIDQQDNAPLRHTITQAVDAKINVIPWLPVSANYTSDQLFTDGANVGDPLYNQNFTDPNQSDDKTTVGLTFNKLPGLSVNAGGYVQYIRQLFLPTYIATEQTLMDAPFSPDNTQDITHEEVDFSYRMPAKLMVLGNDMIKAEADYDTNLQAYDQPLTVTGTTQFEDTSTQTRTIKAAYSGSYKWGKWVSLAPSYSLSEVDAEGDIVAPSVVAGEGNPYYSLDSYGRVDQYTPQRRVLNPALAVQLANLGPVQNTKIAYNFSQTMDYVQNSEETPGSLNFATSLNAASLGPAYKAFPPIDLAQSWQQDSVINDNVTVRGPYESGFLDNWIQSNAAFNSQYEPSIEANDGPELVPNIALESQAPWNQSVWAPRLGFFGDDLFSGPLDVEDLGASASRRSTTTLSTHFNLTLLPGWSGAFTPRASYTDARTMSEPEQITENTQYSLGTGIAFQKPRIPFSAFFRPDNLTFDGSYSYAENWVDDIESPPDLSSVATSYNFKATLPTRPNDRTTVTFSFGTAVTDNDNYNLVNGANVLANSADTLSLTPGLRVVYLLNMSRPIRLPNFWPFYGREMRLKQAIRLDNSLSATINSAFQNATEATLENTASDLYTLNDQVSYNVLENVKVNFALEQNYMVDPYASEAINQPGGYYSLKVSLGAEATF